MNIEAILAQHQVYVLRLGAQYGNQASERIAGIFSEIDDYLKHLEGLKRKPSNDTIIRKINEIAERGFSQITQQLNLDFKEFGGYESNFLASRISEATTLVLEPTSAAAIYRTSKAIPVKLGNGTYTPFGVMVKDYSAQQVRNINGAVTNGLSSGGTIRDITNAIREELSVVEEVSARKARTIARTGVNHVANVARLDLARHDGVIGFEFNATLDSRVSRQCSALDGEIFGKDDPKLLRATPPLHPNCRSSLVPIVDPRYEIDREGGRPSAFTVDGKRTPRDTHSRDNYFGELAKLSARDQDAVLGRRLGAAFRKMDADKFSRLLIDSTTLQPYTMKELAKRDNELGRLLRGGNG